MILILVICALVSGVFFLNLNYKYWKKRGVPGPEPRFFFGNLLENFLLKKSLSDIYSEIYKNFQEAPIVGIFRVTTPSLIIRDPDLIKDITVKSFHNFHENDVYLDKNIDPLAGRNPFFSRGEEWKLTRTHLTTGFTTGKIKLMHPLLEEVGKNLVEYITSKLGEGVNANDLCMRFTLNNVGTCAFGVDAKCFQEENSEFKQLADRFLLPEGWQNIKLLLVRMMPVLSKLVSIKFTPKDVEEKLLDMVKQTLKFRESNNIVRNDFLDVMQQLTKDKENFTEVDITAHASGFFFDAYETTALAMHFLLYELAANPDVQTKLRKEIKTLFEENNDVLPYEELQKLPYLDAVFKEALRMHPPLGSLIKICTKSYTYVSKTDSVIKRPVVIEAGTPVIVPLFALHRDPKYFNSPDLFKPERFLDGQNISNFAFLPFGKGPRTCLGQRFGSLQVKIGVAYIIRNFILSVNKKTQLPIRHDPLYFLTLSKNGIWLDFKIND